MKMNWRSVVFYSLILLVILSLASPFFSVGPKTQELSFSDFVRMAEDGKVTKVVITGDTVSGTLQDNTLFRTRAIITPQLLSTLQEKGVNVTVQSPAESSWLWNLVVQLLLPFLFFIGLWYLLIRQAQVSNSQAMSFGRTRAKPLIETPKVTFDDVAGADEAKEELMEIVEFLKSPEKFREIGAKIPRGVLLMGPPGTGKTLLARAVAGQAGVQFFSISGSDFVEMFVGVGASRVRDLFGQAKKASPAIIFMDEIDAVGRHRGAGLGGGHDEREQTLNQLLVEMDGFDTKVNIVIIAATNRPDILDPALLRPGRFDRQVVLDKPDVKGREAILKIHTRGKKFDADVELAIIAKRTPGFTGADLENLLNEAVILAARHNKKTANMDDVEDAIDRIIAGPEKKSKVLSDKEKEIVAYHELGHAILARLLPHADPVHRISILPRGFALGYTLQLPTQDKYLISRSELLDRITVMIGGRAAEELIFGELTTGAHNDLERATETVRKMVCEFGMSKVGMRTFGKRHEQIFLGREIGESRDYGEKTAEQIDNEIQRTLDDVYAKGKQLLKDNVEHLHVMAKMLMDKETIEGDMLEEIFKPLGAAEKAEHKPRFTVTKQQQTIAPDDAPSVAEKTQDEKKSSGPLPLPRPQQGMA